MSYGWDEEVRADAPAARFRLGDARGSSTAVDAVGGAPGSIRGGVTLGQVGLLEADTDGAALLDGIDGFISIADRAGVKVTGNGAIEFVISATSYRDSGGFAGCIYDGGAREPIIRWAPAFDGRILVRVNSVGDITTSLTTIPLGVRTHVMVTFTLDGRAKIYVNGSDVTGTVTAQTVTSNALPKCIGAADGGANNFFVGTIDELAIYNTSTPTQQRARAHYRAMFGVPASAARPLFWMDQAFPAAARTLLRVLKPDGAQVGDLICVGLRLNSTVATPGHADWTLPAGALQVNTTAAKNHELAFLWHRVGDTDPASWDIVWGGSSLMSEAWARVVRGAPAVGDPIGVIAGAALSSVGTSVPFAGPTAPARGLAMCVWSRFSSGGFPNQPEQWHYGAGLDGGAASVGSFERRQGGAGKLPYMTGFAGPSDAWTTLQFVIRDGAEALPTSGFAIGLAGTPSPNDGGWPDPYTPTIGLGANHVRVDFGPGKSQRSSDVEFADAAARGLRVLPVISQYDQRLSTIDKAAFAAYVGDFTQRYGPGGAFWTDREDGHLAPIWVEVFNEPWGWWFVDDVVEPAEYADLYVQSVAAGRAGNPRCRYLIAGIDRYWTRRIGGGWADWVGPMFVAQPGIGASIDGVTVHLYGTHPLELGRWDTYAEFSQVESVASDLRARGLDVGGTVKLWVTETGFTTVSDTTAPNYGVSEADQASQYLEALRLLCARWPDLLAGFVIYRYRDGTRDDREGRFAIVHNDNSPKPAYRALAGGIDVLPALVLEMLPPDYVSVPDPSPPAMGSCGSELYVALAPIAYADSENGWYLAHLCEAIGRMRQAVSDLVRDSDEGVGWSAMLDVDRAPGADAEIDCLPFLGQFAGARNIAHLSDVDRRAAIREREGYWRGTLRAVLSTAESFTDGTPGAVELRERYNPALGMGVDAAYRGRLRLRGAFLNLVGDDDFIVARIKARIPIGLVYEVVVTDDRTWDDVDSTYASWDAAEADNVDWDDLESFD